MVALPDGPSNRRYRDVDEILIPIVTPFDLPGNIVAPARHQ
jgi:hypothetical protein